MVDVAMAGWSRASPLHEAGYTQMVAQPPAKNEDYYYRRSLTPYPPDDRPQSSAVHLRPILPVHRRCFPPPPCSIFCENPPQITFRGKFSRSRADEREIAKRPVLGPGPIPPFFDSQKQARNSRSQREPSGGYFYRQNRHGCASTRRGLLFLLRFFPRLVGMGEHQPAARDGQNEDRENQAGRGRKWRGPVFARAAFKDPASSITSTNTKKRCKQK